MNRKILSIFIVSIMLFTTFTGVGANAEDDLTKALKENLIPIKTTLAESGLEDLMPLKEILKDKKIVSMGEATHGTAEFFQMKHRMFEFLVKEMDYRVFGIEANFGSSKTINDYILHGEGSVEECLNSMGFLIWDTKEVADMINWMKKYNKNLKENDKIRFYGFDMQSLDNSLIYVLDYLGKVGSSFIEGFNSKLKINYNKIIRISKGNADEVAKDIDKIHKEIIENKDNFISKSSLEEYDLILHHIETIYQCLDYEKDYSFNKRDYYMAENVNWILDYESKYYDNNNIMLWAHNGHVGNDHNMFTIMGENLKEYHGDDYYSIGFDFYQGDFVAVPAGVASIFFRKGLINFNIDSAPKNSFTYEMMKTEEPISFLDFTKFKENKVLLEFLSKKIHVNSIGATYSSRLQSANRKNQVILKDTFDGIIFIESTTGAVRSRLDSELQDGNNFMISSLVLNLILIIAGLAVIAMAIIKTIKNSRVKNKNGYYLFNMDKEDSINKRGIKGLIVRKNDYLNSISITKYWILIVLVLTILSLISDKVNSIDLTKFNFTSNQINIMSLLISTGVNLLEIYLKFLTPFTVVKLLLDSKYSNLINIIIAAIIGAVISTLEYRYSGIWIYSLNIFLGFMSGIIYCYSYDLLNNREEIPVVNFIVIIFFYNLLVMLYRSILTKYI